MQANCHIFLIAKYKQVATQENMKIVELPKANLPESIIPHSPTFLRFLHITSGAFTNTSSFPNGIGSWNFLIILPCTKVQTLTGTM
jgi:hypothetical protein